MTIPHAASRPERLHVALDLLRAGSSFLVVLAHARVHMFVGREEFLNPNLLLTGFVFLSGFGYPAVMVFFVLSGYLVGGRLWRAPLTGVLLTEYSIARLSRLWVVLLPTLVLTFLLASSRLVVTGDSDELRRPDFAASAFVVNALFLQGVMGPSYGGNTPLWSLTYEFWYYALFPSLLIALRGPRRWHRVAGAVAATTIVFLVGKKITLYFLMWLLGAATALLPVWRVPTVIGCSTFLAPFVLARMTHPQGFFWTDLGIACGTAVLISSLRSPGREYEGPACVAQWAGTAAGFSYTLYLVHYPLLVAAAWWMSGRLGELGLQPDLAGWGKYCVAILVSVGGAWLLSLVTERHTNRLRHWLRLALRIP